MPQVSAQLEAEVSALDDEEGDVTGDDAPGRGGLTEIHQDPESPSSTHFTPTKKVVDYDSLGPRRGSS